MTMLIFGHIWADTSLNLTRFQEITMELYYMNLYYNYVMLFNLKSLNLLELKLLQLYINWEFDSFLVNMLVGLTAGLGHGTG